MKKTKTVYYVDIVDVKASQSIVSVFHSENSEEAYEVAAQWNEGLHNPKCIYYTEANLKAEVYEIEEEIEEVKEMDYKEQIKKVVQEFYDVAKAFATSRHYIISYWWVESNFGLDLNDKKIRDDVWEMSSSNDFCDLIQALDFDDVKKEVIVMIWEKGKGAKEMKKYTIEDYEEFSREALDAPPIEAFEDGAIDEDKWFKENKIIIIKGEHRMELDYLADNVNEIDRALREMYEVEIDLRSATTGNTVGSEYRPAELKDIVRYFIVWRYENWGGLNWFGYAQQAIVEMSDIQSVIGVYEHICKTAKDVDFKCNWHNLKVETLKDATEEGIKKIILDLVGSDLEISYDPSTDKSFIIDYTFKESGDFIGWSWGQIDEDIQRDLLLDYKTTIFAE